MELEPLHQLGREDRKLLEFAAILHDIGYYVSSRSHHRHTLNMIMMEPLLGFSREERNVIANIARHYGVDPEASLRSANTKFERRFRFIEDELARHGKLPKESDLEEMDELWNAAKLKNL